MELGRNLARARRAWYRLPRRDSITVFSQEGEDLLLWRLFNAEKSGFYVDVGAHHPLRFSNTFLLYLHGWSGIVIDPLPGTSDRFRRVRSKDIVLEIGIGDEDGVRRYFRFREPAYNTFDPVVAETHAAFSRPEGAIDVPVRPLASVLEEHLPVGGRVDILSVDVEGLDEEVLRSNDWDRFRPQAVCFEVLAHARHRVGTKPSAVSYIEGQGYRRVAETINSVIYAEKRWLDASPGH